MYTILLANFLKLEKYMPVTKISYVTGAAQLFFIHNFLFAKWVSQQRGRQ
jgi:hypothetical protein